MTNIFSNDALCMWDSALDASRRDLSVYAIVIDVMYVFEFKNTFLLFFIKQTRFQQR
jgi:hypothetical protein